MEWLRIWWNAKIEWFRDTARPLKGYRTVIVNGLMALGVFLLEVTNYLLTTDVGEYVPSQFVHLTPWVLMGVNLLNIWLRLVTTTKVGTRDEEGTPTFPKPAP